MFVIVHYGELALKGRNRPWFINTLLRSMKVALADLGFRRARFVLGRIELEFSTAAEWPEVRARLARLPGLGNFSRAVRVPADLDAMSAEAIASVAGLEPRTFRIAARRADKQFPTPTPQIEREIGARVQAATGWPVNLSAPQIRIFVEILRDVAFVYASKERGAGGLPIGTSGRVTCLLSGGIDSPVAAARMIRRGCRVDFVHFHSYPILSRTSQDKARALVTTLTRHQLKSRLFLVPFAPIQQQVVIAVPPPIRVVIYRRLMMRIAEEIARKRHTRALVTGDAVGQVASQTLDNLHVVGSVATLPVLRPLIGFDKSEITAEAERLETYQTSIVPDEDCCTLFTPRFPTTRASMTAVLAAESHLDVAGLVERAVVDSVVEEFRFPMVGLAVPNGPSATKTPGETS